MSTSAQTTLYRKNGKARRASSLETLLNLIARGTRGATRGKAAKSPRPLTITLGGLAGDSKYYVLSRLHEETKRPILFINDGGRRGEEAAASLAYFFGFTPPELRRRERPHRMALFSSTADEQAMRIRWLQCARTKPLVVAEAPALLDKTIPLELFERHSIPLSKGESVRRDHLLEQLRQIGYVETPFVEAPGEMSARGSIVDIFSPGSGEPLRVEMLGDEIHSLRPFSTQDQKSIGRVDAAIIVPASEVVIDDETAESALAWTRRKAVVEEMPASEKLEFLKRLESRVRFPGIEWLIPAFYANPGSPIDFLPQDALVVINCAQDLEKRIESYVESLPAVTDAVGKLLSLSPATDELFLGEGALEDSIDSLTTLRLEELEIRGEGDEERIEFQTEAIKRGGDEYESPFDYVEELVTKLKDERYDVHIVLQTDVEKKKFTQILKERGITGVATKTGRLSAGFIFPEESLAVIAESDVFGPKKRVEPAAREAPSHPSAFITSFSELKPGDYIVHREVGIGKFQGLKRLTFGATEGDFLVCEYQGGDKIYVPVENLKLVQRYIGDTDRPPKMDKLGSQNWKKVVRRVTKAVLGIAKDLIELYARRKAQKGFRFSKGDKMSREFDLSFPYEETPDQEAAIGDVIRDMESQMPMDRLICGDVGFGKTEVALRAAFKAVADGKQVAVLTPTTLLARQHYITFLNRFRGYPVTIATLSRFTSAKEEKETIGKLAEGRVDILIGTHKLLNARVKFRDLGLVVIDEEQRFGVKHKEKLRRVKGSVDVLTLSATPIPRTLQMSLAGIRDISVIMTPPEGRQSVETTVCRYGHTVMQDAITNEMTRKGATFFVHNRIHDIHHWAEQIQRLVPEARIEVTHGRMRERELERSMLRFVNGEVDVLVTTAIVESGLDIPRANTMIVNDAHKFGLADLYQLRGRVGRSERKAYAIFLVPGKSSLTEFARRRLRAIVELKELGTGFKLALSDLEIRGAGNIFGSEQSGHIGDVGLEMYLDMLDRAVKALKNEEEEIEEYEPEIKSHAPAFIPDTYIPDSAERLFFYKRLASLSSPAELKSIRTEMRDRFGRPPKTAERLMEVINLKLLMKRLLIEKIEITPKEAVIIFHEKSPHLALFKPSGRHRIPFDNDYGPRAIARKLKEFIGA